MKRFVFFFCVLIVKFSTAQDKPFYLGLNIINGISIPTGEKSYNDYERSAYAPSCGLQVEKRLNRKFSIQSGIMLVDRASNKEIFAYDFTDPDLYTNNIEKINQNII